MDKEEFKDKLSEELKKFVYLNIDDNYIDIKKDIEDFVRENLPQEPPFKNINTKLNEKGDGMIMEFELNPYYKSIYEEYLNGK